MLAGLGAARVVDREAQGAELRDAITALVEDGSHATAAAAIGARLRAQDGAARAADRIEALVSPRVASLGAPPSS